jgi:RNA polymerase sigma-70 factor, ECF subfamily
VPSASGHLHPSAPRDEALKGNSEPYGLASGTLLDQDGTTMATPIPPDAASPPGYEDLELVRRMQQRDEQALQQLYRRYAGLVFRLACRVLDRAAAEEVVQDAFLTVWRKAYDFDPSRGSFRTWLLTIGRHRMLDEIRARSRRPQTSGDPLLEQIAFSAEDPLPDESLWLEYQRDVISGALAALPEPQRAALRLAFFADLSHEEVARVLNVPLGTAKTRIRSGLRRLERHLGGLVAVLTVALAGVGFWLYQHKTAQELLSERAVHLLANSQTKALRLVPPGSSATPEFDMHATFRCALGSDLAVLTLSHFPPLVPGEHDLIWIRTAEGWLHLELHEPDGEGKALQIMKTPWLVQAWPLELRISRETRPVSQPSKPALVEWKLPTSQAQPAFP